MALSALPPEKEKKTSDREKDTRTNMRMRMKRKKAVRGVNGQTGRTEMMTEEGQMREWWRRQTMGE